MGELIYHMDYQPGQEITVTWSSLHRADQLQVLAGFREAAMKLSKQSLNEEKLQKVFELGQPSLVLGKTPEGFAYCRIADCSVDVMQLLIKNYLL
jgi:hypothetical protein